MANRLRRMYGPDVDSGRTTVTVIDEETQHVYQPGLLFLPFGLYTKQQILRDRRPLLHRGVQYIQATIQRVDHENNYVELADGTHMPYDVLIVASGARIAPAETEGLTGPGWMKNMFDFYTLDGAIALRQALERFDGGNLVINVVEMPIKCPVAPLEFAFLADWYFTRRGIRDRVNITYVTPLDGAFTKPIASAALSHLLSEKGIALVSEFSAGSVDGNTGILSSWDNREVPFDLLVTVPLHMGAAYVERSTGLGDDMGFILTNPLTLQSTAAPNIFAIGDATNLPTSKAGSVAHFEGEVLAANIRRFLNGQLPEPAFDGHANCFIETGHDKALLIDFNYDTQPLPGLFPIPVIGPMRLLEESRLNHLGKLAFRWFYWNVILPGRDFPGMGARMSMRGKRRLAPPAMPAHASVPDAHSQTVSRLP